MAKSEKIARKKLRSSSYFLECFGFSRKLYSEKPMVVKEEDFEKKKKKNKKRLSRWFLCSKFCKKNGEIKPSPIEETEKPNSRVVDETDKPKNVCVIRRITDRKNVPVDDKPVNQETKQTKPKELRNITPKPLSSIREEDTSPVNISTSELYKKPDLKPNGARNGSRVNKLDPVIGLSIIILTLMIMLVWGRVCAILCTSAWCYILPGFRNAAALVKRKRNGVATVNMI